MMFSSLTSHIDRVLILALLTLLSFNVQAERISASQQQHAAWVQGLLDAFNRHDAAAMGMFLAEDIEWINLNGKQLSIEAQGKSALLAAMQDYFSSCPSCRSSISHFVHSEQRLSTVETAHWENAQGTQQQSSLVVYEFNAEQIQRVYYFPSEASKHSP